MKKIIKFSYFALLSGLFLASCSSSKPVKVVEYNFAFNCTNCTINGHDGEYSIKVLSDKTNVEFTIVPKKDYVLPFSIIGTSSNVHYERDSGVITIDKMTSNVNVTITATNSTIHTVSFDSNGGSPVVNQNIQDGELLTEPSTTKAGEKFVGWYRGDNKFNFATPITEDNITLTAHWDNSKYTITWKNGDTVVETDSNVVYGSKPTYDGSTPTIESTAAQEYEFIGWEPAISEKTIVEKDQTYRAVFSSTTREYQVRWLETSDKLPPLQQDKVKYRGQVSFKGDNPVREATDSGKHGYIFKGWLPNPADPILTDTDFIAQWDDTYLIVFKTYDGSIISSSFVKAGVRPKAPKDPIKPGDDTHKYTFAGWDNEKYPSGELPVVDGPHEYVAQFNEEATNVARVTFYVSNGVMYENNYQDVVKGNLATKPDKDPYRAGYSFAGWYDVTGTNEFNFSTPINADTEIQAKWEEDDSFKTPFYYENDSGSTNTILLTDNLLYKTNLSSNWVAGPNKNVSFTGKIYVTINNALYFDKGDFPKPTKKHKIGGNIMSIYNNNDDEFPFMYEAFSSQFDSLFDSDNNLTSAESLLLPATSLGESCYNSMFFNCDNLVMSPKKLPAAIGGGLSYQMMFMMCTSLLESPYISINNAKNGDCSSMFSDCSSLSKVTVGFGIKNQTTWPLEENSTLLWLFGVRATGDFIWEGATEGFAEDFFGSHTIPVGWNVLNPS